MVDDSQLEQPTIDPVAPTPVAVEAVPQADISMSDDPQAEQAANGFRGLLSTAPVQQALDVGANLDRHQAMVQAAIAGDPNARLELARHSLGTAMGTLEPLEGTPNYFKTQELSAREVQNAAQTAKEAAIATSKLNAARDATARFQAQLKARRGYAEGGEVDIDQAFNQAFAEPTVAPPQAQAPAEAPQSEPVNVINPEVKLVSIPGHQLQDALSSGYQQASEEHIHRYAQEQKYGGAGQQAIAGLEGAAEGASFGLSTGAETALGVNPEDIRGRREVNPVTHGVGQVAGLVGSLAIPGVGEANILRAGGEGVAALAGLEGGSRIAQIGAAAAKGAFENALFQGGDEVSKAFAQDPSQTAESAIADIGLAGVMGGVFGGAAGAAVQGLAKLKNPGTFISQIDRPAFDAGDFQSTIRNSDLIKPEQKEGILAGLSKQKAEAPEIRAAAERLGAPVMEGMVSDSPLVQKAEDSLINGAPTYSGIKRQALYKEGFDKAASAVDQVLGEEGRYSKAELGNILKTSITDQLETQNAPIKAMYDEIKLGHEVIPLAEEAAPKIAEELKGIKELSLSPSSPEGQLVNRVVKEIGNLKTVDDVKSYKSILNRSISPTASSGEKRMVSILSDKLTDLEENSIERFARNSAESPEAKAKILDLIDQRKAANAGYKDLINKVKTLSEQLGKGRIHGLQDAMHFIRDKLTPEEVTTRLFSKNNSEFLKFFDKEFPEQMQLMREYQKSSLREGASKAGVFSPNMLFNKVNKLEPEIQKSIFAPEELQKLKDAETYIRSFPKNFNPSGTSGMNAFRGFFEHPVGAAIANARDVGIEGFIKAVSRSPEVNNATALAKSTVNGWNATAKAVKSIFNSDSPMPSAATVATASLRNKLNKIVQDYMVNPDKMFQMNANNPMPAYAGAFSQTSARAMQYLSTVKPNTDPTNPLDTRQKPSPAQQAAYNRALDIAQKPLSVLNSIKTGRISPQDINTLKAIYPNLYGQLAQKLQAEMIDTISKGKSVPYQTRIGLSMFLAKPLDSTMTPGGITAAQMANQSSAPASQQPQGEQKPPSESKLKGLNKLPQSYQTPEQSRQQRQNK